MSEYPCGGSQREQELMLYVGGELPPWERLRMEAHLRTCPRCRRQQRLLHSTMQSIAAEVRGGGLPHWEAQGMVSATAVSGRFSGRSSSGARLATMAAVSAALAVLTSYMAATYGDRLIRLPSAPLSRVNTAVPTPACRNSPAAKVGKTCHSCAGSAPKANLL